MFLSVISHVKYLAIVCAVFCVSASASAFGDNVSFDYQGRVKVEGKAFTGAGLIKLAILNTSGSAVLWSNDGTIGTGSGGNIPEPSGALAQHIEDGVFSIAVGDENVPGMAPLESSVMISDTPLRLRVWFNDGSHGFQQLNPDQKLVDITLTRLQSGTKDFTIYVNGQNGNDDNNGLTPQTAKQSISGAVDILPDKVRCNITVDIADGTYREIVIPHGISVAYGKKLLFIGDEDWTPASSGWPSVVIDGADSDNIPVRDYGFHARQCTGITIEGITFQNAKISGLSIENGDYVVHRCFARNNPVFDMGSGKGFKAGPQVNVAFTESMATGNGHIGICVESSSRATLNNCTATLNPVGLFCSRNSVSQLYDYNKFNNNGIGLQANQMSEVSIWPSNSNTTRTHIQNNTEYAFRVNWGSIVDPQDAVMTGNAGLYSRYYGTVIGVDSQ